MDNLPANIYSVAAVRETDRTTIEDHGVPGYTLMTRAGEAAVRDVLPEATILRPSVLFGPGDAFFNTFAKMAGSLPVLPLFGAGATRLQPVFVEDVAEAATRALADPAAKGRDYELGGPQSYSYRELLRLVLKQTGRWRPLLPVPFALWHVLAALSALFPWELGEKADAFAPAPAGIKPEWYFLFMFQALKKLPPEIMGIEGEVVGVVFFGLAFLVVLIVPFIDQAEKPGRARKVLNVLASLAVIFFFVMTIWGLAE